MILEATHTHLYPGHKGKISGLAQIADMQASGDCLVEFSDGSATPARISKSEDAWQLHTEAYRTAAGTDIGARSSSPITGTFRNPGATMAQTSETGYKSAKHSGGNIPNPPKIASGPGTTQ
jgi:hypothetical protein